MISQPEKQLPGLWHERWQKTGEAAEGSVAVVGEKDAPLSPTMCLYAVLCAMCQVCDLEQVSNTSHSQCSHW